MRYIIIAVLSCTLGAGCGGGGDTPLPSGGGGGGNSVNLQNTLQTLQDCAPDTINDLLSTLGVLRGLADGTLPAVTLQGVDNVGKSFGFMIDLDNDGQPDLLGNANLEDGQGQPANVDLSPLQGQGIAALPGILATMPDGAILLVNVNSTIVATVAFTSFMFQGGLPSTADGRLELAAPTCQVVYSFTGVSAAGLLGAAIPTVVLDTEMNGAANSLLGTSTFDGTDVVRFDVRIDDLEDFSVTYDMQSGQFTDVTGS